jgi:hypothetical protein
MALTPNTQNYTPRFYQGDLWAAMGQHALVRPEGPSRKMRRAFLLWARRNGKDKTCFNFMVNQALTDRVGNYAYFFPKYAQGREALWTNTDSDGFRTIEHVPASALKRRVDDEMLLELRNGSTIQILGGDSREHIDRHRSANFIGVVKSEYAWINPYLDDVVAPILRANGGWEIYNTTPNGPNHAKKLWDMACRNPLWFAQIVTCRDSGVPTLQGIEEERQERLGKGEAPEEVENYIQREYYCSFAAPTKGTVYGHLIVEAEKQGRIRVVRYDPNYPVHTCWDIGHRDATAIWSAQVVKGETRFIDYYEVTGSDLPQIAKVVLQKPYVYGAHIPPHDIKVHEWGAGESRIKQAETLGLVFEEPVRLSLADGINATRSLLKHAVFDEQKCAQGLDALRSYHYKVNEETRVLSMEPESDWAEHGASALRYYAVSQDKVYETRSKPDDGVPFSGGTREHGWMR